MLTLARMVAVASDGGGVRGNVTSGPHASSSATSSPGPSCSRPKYADPPRGRPLPTVRLRQSHGKVQRPARRPAQLARSWQRPGSPTAARAAAPQPRRHPGCAWPPRLCAGWSGAAVLGCAVAHTSAPHRSARPRSRRRHSIPSSHRPTCVPARHARTARYQAACGSPGRRGREGCCAQAWAVPGQAPATASFLTLCPPRSPRTSGMR